MISEEDMKVTSQTEGVKHQLQGKGLLLPPGREAEDCRGNRAGAEVSDSLALGRTHNLQPLFLLHWESAHKQKGFGQTRTREAHLFSLKIAKK